MAEDKRSRSVLVTGSRGVIGKILSERLSKDGYQVIGTRRESQAALDSMDEVVMHPWREIQMQGRKVDAVIHLAGKYITKDDLASQKETFDSVVGLSAAVADLIAIDDVPLVATGSFFEKSPESEPPWSHYSIAKVASRELLRLACQRSNQSMSYLYLYDTFGAETRRGKFLDLLLENLNGSKALAVSEGRQVQDLTHIDDVATGIIQTLQSVMLGSTSYSEWQIRSYDVFTLQALANLVEKELKVKLNIQWGAVPYRKKEVFELWNSAPDLPGFKPKFTLSEYLRSINTGEKLA